MTDMIPCKAVHVMALFLVAAAFCVDAEVILDGTKCGPLREGVYLAEYSFPTEIGGINKVPQVKSVINLVKDGIGYHGTGAGVAFNSQNEELLPRDIPIFTHLWATFDRETCTLSGAIYNFKAYLVEAFKWDYDGRVISGNHVTRVNETVPFLVEAFAKLTPTFD